MTAMRRATRADRWAEERALDHRPHEGGIRATEQVAWQRLHTVAAAAGSGTATYRGTLHAWRAARYDLDRALVPVPPAAVGVRRTWLHDYQDRGAALRPPRRA